MKERGIALVAVLVTLSILLALAIPFMLSMSVGQSVAFTDSDRKTAELASASVRDLLLSEAGLGHASVDPTPRSDGRDEYPDRVLLPEAFGDLTRGGRVLLSGEVWDLQRKLHIDGVSPLALANLLGTSARLLADLEPESDVIAVADASRFPETGFLWIDHELIHYGSRGATAFGDLTRGLFPDMGFVPPTAHTVPETGLVLDFRCVIAASWPFSGRFGGLKAQRVPYSSVREVARIAELSFGGFTAAELELLETYCTAHGSRETATTWGRAERVFSDLVAGIDRTLRVRSGLHLGAGSTVRIRNIRTGEAEFGLVMTASVPRGARDLNLASEFLLHLLTPVTRDFPALDTVVEPLLPYPVNVNTAPPELLAALFVDVRRVQNARVHDGDGRQRAQPEPAITAGEARELAFEIAGQRGDAVAGESVPIVGPFRNWRDMAERLFQRRFDEARGFPEKNRWIRLYRNLLTGRDAMIEMGTAPLCFASGPMVGYRAAAAYDRGLFATGTAARMERRGTAVAMPGVGLDVSWGTQELLDEALRLDRRSPWWLTTPINTSAVNTQERGNDPVSRYLPHLIALAFPTAGFGQARFPSADGADAAVQPAPAYAPIGVPAVAPRAHESFGMSLDPLGRRIGTEGVYLARNIGPRDRTPQQQPAFDGDHSRVSFPFTVSGGVAGRFGVQFWAQPDSLGNQTLLDYSDGDDERNRISVQVRDGNLVMEVIDEAGIDPNPGIVATSPERSAGIVSVPIAELGLQPGVPVHFNLSGYGNRPTEMSLLVDGVPRTKPRYLTFLTAPVPLYDPVNQAPTVPGRDERFLDIYVESTEGFPSQGILRIGLELFEYTAASDGVFHCQFRDSMGGRMARMIPREYRPAIPTDERGRPVVDVNNLPGGANLDIAPDHPVGAAVELYGYSTALYRDTILQVGSTALAEAVAPFAIARGFVRNGVPITVQGPVPPGLTIDLGTGLDETFSGDIDLYPPVPLEPNNPQPEDRISNAFPQGGGFALLVQHRWDWDFQPGGRGLTGETSLTGGVELIRYSARQGNRLTGIQRAFPLPGDNRGSNRDFYDGTARKFVSEWAPWIFLLDRNGGQAIPFNEAPTMMLFVVPISLPVQNADVLVDPQALGYSEWLQLYPRGDESDTEWVRYDMIQDRRHVLRSNRGAWERLRFGLTFQQTVQRVSLTGSSARVTLPLTNPWPQPRSSSGYIGYIEKVEEDYPAIHTAREELDFRGDRLTGTTSHAHGPESRVLPVHRMELDWGNYGALTARAGRNDRVAFVKGSAASGTSRPAVEWHVANWTARRYGGDPTASNGAAGGGSPSPPVERLGPWPFQLVGLKDRLAGFYEGPAERQDFTDTRLVDRMVKFPSGELPSAYVEDVTFGSAAAGGERMDGVLDEITIVNQIAQDLVLDEVFSDSAAEFRVRPDLAIVGYGPVVVNGDLSAAFPPGGGLVMIDGEILAYQSRDDGLFQIALNGRGLLGTEARAHDRGTRVRFLTHVPAAILAAGVQPQSDVLPLQALNGLPSASGTVLLGRELLHYAWTRVSGDLVSIEMPRWYSPGEVEGEGGRPRGLLRGRYGTDPQGAGAGEPVIWFPFRYWDRYRERADDPELAYFQFSHAQAPVLWSGIQWDEEIPDATVDVHCYVRVDGKGTFADDPAAVPSLFLLTHGDQDDRVLPLDYQGSELEARFYTVYRQGAFDPASFLAHGWKMAPRIRNVRVQYEGQGRIVHEEVTSR